MTDRRKCVCGHTRSSHGYGEGAGMCRVTTCPSMCLAYVPVSHADAVDCPHLTGDDACTACRQVAAVEGLLALLAKVSTSPNMTVEVRHVRYALDKGRVPDLLAGKKVGQAAGP